MRERVGPYRLERELSRGGQGVVYVARAADGSRVALKVLLGHEPTLVRRFDEECRVLLGLRHQYLVRALDGGSAEGVRYLAMEFVEGEDLATRLEREGPATVPRVVDVVAKVAEALEVIHDHGLVHRDLKPGNVMVEAGSGRVVLVDFGIVKRDPAEFGVIGEEPFTRLSATGEIVGTLGFMAPEQADPKFGPVSPRTDVHGLAAVAFALLCGESPYRQRDAVALVFSLVREGPAPSPREVNPQLSAPVARVCQQGLSKSQQDRPPSALAFAQALAEAAAAGEAGPKDTRRGLGLVAVTGGLGALLALGVAASIAFWPQDPEPRVVGADPGPSARAADRQPSEPAPVREPAKEPTPRELFLEGRRLREAGRATEAVEHFRRAALRGDADAQNKLGDMCCLGEGTPKDLREGARWYRLACDQDHPNALLSLGILHSRPEVGVDRAKSLQLLRRSAALGEARAESILGQIYAEGLGVPVNKVKAVEHFEKAALAGNVDGKSGLAVALLFGEGVAQDAARAVELLQEAAEEGHPSAMLNLGIVYGKGMADIPFDARLSRQWLERAAATTPPTYPSREAAKILRRMDEAGD